MKRIINSARSVAIHKLKITWISQIVFGLLWGCLHKKCVEKKATLRAVPWSAAACCQRCWLGGADLRSPSPVRDNRRPRSTQTSASLPANERNVHLFHVSRGARMQKVLAHNLCLNREVVEINLSTVSFWRWRRPELYVFRPIGCSQGRIDTDQQLILAI